MLRAVVCLALMLLSVKLDSQWPVVIVGMIVGLSIIWRFSLIPADR